METVDSVYPFIGRRFWHRFAVLMVAMLPLAGAVWGILALWGAHIGMMDLVLLLSFWGFSGLGISVGYHRHLTHGAFKARRPVRAVLLLAGLTALQGGPATWAATHRRHHAVADRPGDPHSPLEGLWHAHFGWMRKGNIVSSGPAYRSLMEDPIVRFFERTQLVWGVLGIVVPGLIAWAVTGSPVAGWYGLLWGGALRVVLMHHITWSINSICHTWGTRPYDSPDVARNNVIFALLGFGEGWHNNHHAQPSSAYLGHRWYQIDIGRFLVQGLRALRLISDVRLPDRKRRQAHANL